MNLKSHRQFVREQIEKSPDFAHEYDQARSETRFAIVLAMLREERGLIQQQLTESSVFRAHRKR